MDITPILDTYQILQNVDEIELCLCFLNLTFLENVAYNSV